MEEGLVKIEIHQEYDMMNRGEMLVIRVTEFGLREVLPQEFAEVMREAIKHFVATNPECQILINQMVVEAFKSVDLLAAITEVIKQKVAEVSTSSIGKDT